MFKPLGFLCIFTVVTFCAAVTTASPIVDGSLDAANYDWSLSDAPGETAYTAGLDIDKVYFAQTDSLDPSGASRYVCLDVVGSLFDTNGTSLRQKRTGVVLSFYDSATDYDANVEIVLTITDLGLLTNYSFLTEWDPSANGGLGGYVEQGFDGFTAGNEYDYAVGEAMELRLSLSAFQVYNSGGFPGYVVVHLDDAGMDPDDELEGHVPEPVTLSLLLAGAPLLLRRRGQGRHFLPLGRK
ncbi:MAG TPA: hypothetical protein DCX07_06755 [Phycisphaerales bacterium]|nr:hypothetical protein [Phycisphaerales bacterium]